MGKRTKDKQIYVRVDDVESEKINAYVEASGNLDVSKLIRVAVAEYMINHPIKGSDNSPTKLKVPGEE